MELLLGIFLGLATLLCAVAVYAEFRSKLHSLDERVKKLEESRAGKVNYIFEQIDHAFSALVVAEYRNEVEKKALDNAREYMTRARNPNKK